MMRRLLLMLTALVLALTLAQGVARAEPSPDGEDIEYHALRHDDIFAQIRAIQPKVYLPNPKHQYQGMNNCGPTTTVIAMSNWGVMRTQTDAVWVLKPNPKDVNVSPWEIVSYIKSQGLEAQWRVNGSLETLQLFLSNDIPVMVEQWMLDDGGMGHYRLATGYNKERGTITFDDSFYGPDQRWSNEDFQARWDEFNLNHIFIPVYPPEKADLVRALLGPDADDKQMWQRAEAARRADLENDPNNARVWFALGDALLNQNRVDEALPAYEKAYTLGLPFRFYWYQFGHFETLAKLGRWQRLLQLTQPVLAKAPIHEEMFYYQGVAYKGMGNMDAARDAFQKSAEANKNFDRTKQALKAMN